MAGRLAGFRVVRESEHELELAATDHAKTLHRVVLALALALVACAALGWSTALLVVVVLFYASTFVRFLVRLSVATTEGTALTTVRCSVLVEGGRLVLDGQAIQPEEILAWKIFHSTHTSGRPPTTTTTHRLYAVTRERVFAIAGSADERELEKLASMIADRLGTPASAPAGPAIAAFSTAVALALLHPAAMFLVAWLAFTLALGEARDTVAAIAAAGVIVTLFLDHVLVKVCGMIGSGAVEEITKRMFPEVESNRAARRR